MSATAAVQRARRRPRTHPFLRFVARRVVAGILTLLVVSMLVFAGTETDGNPNSGRFDATWDIYVNQSLNALSTDATFSQVKATTHPFHYDSICLNGLGCDLSVPPGDRSMADFFSLDYNPADKKIYVTFNRSNKKPDEASGHVANVMVVNQIGGPTIGPQVEPFGQLGT